MSLDRAKTLSARAGNGIPVPVPISDIIDAAASDAATASAAAIAAITPKLYAGRHTVTAGEDTAGTCAIATGAATITAQDVQILRSGAVATGNAAVSVSSATLTVADGATYVLTTGDVINWIAVGT